MALTLYPFSKLGSEFMPPIDEGDLLYMPTTMPGLSITEAKNVLQQTDRIIRKFPEVEYVFGKAGRAETATDPAPLSMIETTIRLKDPEQWPPGMTMEGLIQEMDQAVKFPGLANSWGYPIKIRIDMLSTGIKTPVGFKIMGPDLEVLNRLATDAEAIFKSLPETASAFAERVTGGYYLDFAINRRKRPATASPWGTSRTSSPPPWEGRTSPRRWRGWSATPSTCAISRITGKTSRPCAASSSPP